MSFGGGGFGSTGFGSNNNNNTPTGFGGFGSTANNNAGGFGSNQAQNTGGFGSSNTGGSLFGGGGGGGGFGSNNNNNNNTATSAFGQANKPAFGSTGTGSIFGNNSTPATTTGGFGGTGFGSTANAGATGAFGGGSTGGGLFGSTANKPAFGTGTGTGGSLFGGTSNNNATNNSLSGSTVFGSTASNAGSTPFGNQSASAFTNLAECQGTGGQPFQAYQEKESNSLITNHFQSITFMQPFQKYSFEELRLADYAKGQKQGNTNGQAGQFGASTGFGFGNNANTAATGTGFGSGNTGGLFGNNATGNSTSFGGNNTTAGGFGSGGGGGLFGGNKPAAGGGLFGNNTTTVATATTGNNPFGGGGGAGFGTNNNATGGTGLFGGTNNATKPAGGLFGGGGTTQTTGGGFGSGFANSGTTANTGTNLFGGGNANNTTTGFGNNQPNANPFGGGGGAGQTNASNPFGGAPKPVGLFNNTAAAQPGNALFGGQSNQQQAGSTLFGNNQPQQGNQTNTLFGNNNNNQNKSLFGGGGGNAAGGNTLFGGQPQQGNNLFGGNQPGAQQANTGTSLFNNAQPQNAGNSLFGGTQQNTMGNSGLFSGQNQNAGNNNNNQQQQQNPLQGYGGFSASINDPSPYGSASIFHGLPPPPQQSPGPIATPIASGSIRSKKPAALPQYKLNPAMASRLMTPQQKRGYGFSYSTYGTPSSTTSTPGGLGSSLMGGSLSRSLGKSLSTSNLRSDGEPTSILAPGAFSASSQRYSATGSLKRLTIDRSLKTDLFSNSPPVAAITAPRAAAAAAPAPIDDLRGSALKKKVSFDTTPQVEANGQQAQQQPNERQSATPTAQEQGYLRSSTSLSNGGNSRANGTSDDAADVVVQGNELAIVPEDQSPEAARAKPTNLFVEQADPQPGNYWIEPSLDELSKMPAAAKKAVNGFKIGRENCGFVEFNAPVDLTTVDVENIPDAIAVIELRSLTVYPENAYKPPMGKGLNVPATITLENSWPRARDRKSPSYDKAGPRFAKHVERLKRVPDTEFVDYNKDTGEWTFKVPHFTTYGFDYDDDESVAGDKGLDESTMSQAPPTPTPQGKQVRLTPTPAANVEQPHSFTTGSSKINTAMQVDADEEAAGAPFPTSSRSSKASNVGSVGRSLRQPRGIPGGFESEHSDEEEEEEDEDEAEVMEMEQVSHSRSGSFLVRSNSVESSAGEEEPAEMEQAARRSTALDVANDEDISMAGAFPPIEQDSDEDFTNFSIAGTPMKLIPDLNDDWADRLQQTVSPQKTDRRLLKQSQAILDRKGPLFDSEATPTKMGGKEQEADFGEIKNSVDLMRSLFGKEELRRSGRQGTKAGFQWPYNKRDDGDQQMMDPQDQAFHNSFKPSFAAGNRLVMRRNEVQVAQKAVLMDSSDVSGKAVIFNLPLLSITDPDQRGHLDLNRLMKQTRILVKNNIPAAELRPILFRQVQAIRPASTKSEYFAYELLSVLFDSDGNDEISKSVPEVDRPQFAHRIRKDRLSAFWAALCSPGAKEAARAAKSPEEQAIVYLSMHKVTEACEVLVAGKNFRLATLVAQIGGDEAQRAGMQEQIKTWLKTNVLSEFDDGVRALYTLLSGETCMCEPQSGPVENRVKGFSISKRFGLDWVRAFGLKLWYGVLPEDSLETAVVAYEADMVAGREPTRPDPRVLMTPERSSTSWVDPSPEVRQDMLWTILKLVAEKNQIAAKTRIPAALSPENIAGNPTSCRLSFELHQMLAPRLPRAIEPVKADALTIAFSAELESLGDWRYAIFVLMFIDDPGQRGRALQTSLARIAPRVNENDEDNTDFLFNTLRMPESWFWNAKALESRALGERRRETVFLARGHNWVESHRVLCEEVAPLAVIERDHKRLAEILENFPQKQIAEWRLGGQVFTDYLTLVGALSSSSSGRAEEKSVVLQRLLTALAELKPRPDDRRKVTFAQSVALGEMGRVAAIQARKEEAATGQRGDGPGPVTTQVLMGLPTTDEVQRQAVLEMGLRHFKAAMAQKS